MLVALTLAAPVSAASSVPRLVLQITVDQLRGDLPGRYADRLTDGGFRYLMEKGTWYVNAHYQHANTETAVGHATLATGAEPSRHGIIANDWINQKSGAFVYNTKDDRDHIIGKEPKAHEGVSPRNLVASTFGDELVVSNDRPLAGI
jgi:predicted AlkP superfamily pyrophosphatase or phosphodiesterase